jgi:hypothetical protein
MHRSVRQAALGLVVAASAGAAFAGAAAATPAGRTVRAARSAQDDTTLVGRTITANTALKGGLTSVPIETAVSLVGSIQRDLAATGSPALESIASDLGELGNELGMGTVDGARVGAVLRRLGPKVTTAAATQTGAVASTLRSLGSQLRSAGQQLGGATPVRK